jgi:hypothetical protein
VMPARKPGAVPSADPAGADKLCVAAVEAVTHWAERLISEYARVPVDLWNGPNGLRGVVEEAVHNAGIPNQRFGEFVNPRSVAEGLKLVPKRRRSRRVSGEVKG